MTEMGIISLLSFFAYAVFEPLSSWFYDKVEIKKIVTFSVFAAILIMPLFSMVRELWEFAFVFFLISAASSGTSTPTWGCSATFRL
jgi:sugar phosphate permease